MKSLTNKQLELFNKGIMTLVARDVKELREIQEELVKHNIMNMELYCAGVHSITRLLPIDLYEGKVFIIECGDHWNTYKVSTTDATLANTLSKIHDDNLDALAYCMADVQLTTEIFDNVAHKKENVNPVPVEPTVTYAFEDSEKPVYLDTKKARALVCNIKDDKPAFLMASTGLRYMLTTTASGNKYSMMNIGTEGSPQIKPWTSSVPMDKMVRNLVDGRYIEIKGSVVFKFEA